MDVIKEYIRSFCPKLLVKSGMILYNKIKGYYIAIQKNEDIICINLQTRDVILLKDYDNNLVERHRDYNIMNYRFDKIYDTKYPYKSVDNKDLMDCEIIWERKKNIDDAIDPFNSGRSYELGIPYN